MFSVTTRDYVEEVYALGDPIEKLALVARGEGTRTFATRGKYPTRILLLGSARYTYYTRDKLFSLPAAGGVNFIIVNTAREPCRVMVRVPKTEMEALGLSRYILLTPRPVNLTDEDELRSRGIDPNGQPHIARVDTREAPPSAARYKVTVYFNFREAEV